ncbi:MAG: 50S ribosomal protein L1 [Halobacteriovoraceae bacterium]|nr:50S ribosomal protein L1 [Halobacteriovoraceae bacterium]|tara:strand:- start:1027 stop:1728 length:702 start_codon:yes stop_codon:yes gene_type:complete
MKKMGKKRQEAIKKVDATKLYGVKEAIALAKDAAYANFDETVDVAFRLGVDPRHADQMIRGAIVMPAGTGATVKVCVITSGENISKAEAAGADIVGGDDIIQKIQGGWMDFDRVIATPDMMGKIGRIARILGPRGLMPNPKLGTVTTDVEKAVSEQKAGKVEYRTEKTGIVHVKFGKKSFEDDKLLENFKAIAGAIVRAKPASAKGNYLKSVVISTSMGPGIKVDTNDIGATV